MDDELESLFTEGQTLFVGIEESKVDSNSNEFQHKVQQALDIFANVAVLVSQQHTFSTNEEIDDIRTDLLKFILVPYYQAELHLHVVDKERFDHLASSKRFVSHFLRHCEKLLLVHKEDIKVLHNDSVETPSDRRATLQSRHKREKEARSKLEEIKKQLARGVVDEELQRSHWLAIMDYYVTKAISQIESTEREFKMLESVSQLPPTSRDFRGNVVAQTHPTNKKPIAYTILPGGRRQQLASQVFQPGFNMATITPEQAVDAEIRAGRMIQGGGNEQQKDKDSDDEDEEEDKDSDERAWKARAWDTFKDDNPRGSGNTKQVGL